MANKRLQKIHGPSTCVTGNGDIQGDLGNLVDLMDSDDLVDLDDLAGTRRVEPPFSVTVT